MRELLDQLTQLRAPSIEIADYPHHLQIALITLHGYDGKALDTIRIAHDPTTNRWAFENGDNVLRIHPTDLKLRLTAKDFEVR